ncbi:UvrD-helicase domain-containing protein [Geothrix sp. PMB-07]|uniref:UvrD-helicase domain-containing protein n=1 Tax=Geothrix sp. PMB-07 TaxID=3068640 RepID=UPI002740C222|nr:UvrD-helicase domain-containing protein [Geothrix sp. PMB-07]WLT33559.1 AAA family ATPase [Geothrix sp. PMB-07]
MAIEAPAGTGKTTLISSAVALSKAENQLVLTHTHAGVGAIRRALHRHGVSSKMCHVDTIASWALWYAQSYPGMSGLKITEPDKDDWEEVYRCATALLIHKAIRQVVKESYAGLYVDEYQDCTPSQHRLIVELAGILPCRVLGDPLQSIFEFTKEGVVSWESDVVSAFSIHAGPTEPWRWKGRNPRLGRWLVEVRRALLNNEPIDLRNAPISWKPIGNKPAQRVQIAAAKFLRHAPGESVVAIHKWAPGVHKISGLLGGSYSGIEPIECPDLFKFAKMIQESSGLVRAVAVIDFASNCMTHLGSHLSSIRASLVAGNIPRSQKAKAELEALVRVAESDQADAVIAALAVLREIPGCALYRRELFDAMRRSLLNSNAHDEDALSASAWKTRNATRHIGRRLANHSVGTTLLVKGLEFDHAVILDAEAVGNTKEHLYVALTRGSQSLTVVSRSALLTPSG